MVSGIANEMHKMFFPDFLEYFASLTQKEEKRVIGGSYDTIRKFYGDISGYEHSMTEMRVNDYLSGSKGLLSVLSIALLTLDVWKSNLQRIDPNHQYAYYVSCDQEFVTIRVHRYREAEGTILDDDLEGFEQSVGYMIH